ncbi:unnamed protein product [Fraxinus pennsylvanica]|uniref:Uncharacterized protein n=1 Tax=Fraxinus pennsylvanica TaxID=56036 RepID=A0AAD1ZBU6_9LAMI|nr:unnamed protein product [Fraxinus pennsylvanica]
MYSMESYLCPTMEASRYMVGAEGSMGGLDLEMIRAAKWFLERVQLPAGEDIVQALRYDSVSCRGTHSVALTKDGRMYSFGHGDHGRLGYGRKLTTGLPAEVPINS